MDNEEKIRELIANLKTCASLLGAVAGDIEQSDEFFWWAKTIEQLKKARDEAQALIAKVEG